MTTNPVVVTIENPSVDIDFSNSNTNTDSSFFPDKQKASSPKQFTWVLVIKAYRALYYLALGMKATFLSAKKRILLSEVSQEEEEEEARTRGKLYRFLRAFLAISMVALVIEIVAHYKKWNLGLIHNPWEIMGLVQWSYMAWLSFRVDYAAPILIMLSNLCIVLFMVQSIDRVVQCIGCFWIKCKGLKPELVGGEEEEASDVEDGSRFPMVLVQIPMCNEGEVISCSFSALIGYMRKSFKCIGSHKTILQYWLFSEHRILCPKIFNCQYTINLHFVASAIEIRVCLDLHNILQLYMHLGPMGLKTWA